MEEIKEVLKYLFVEINSIKNELFLLKQDLSFLKGNSPTNSSSIPTKPILTSTSILPFKPLNPKILSISTGNKGVPTDRQTNQQTDKTSFFMRNSDTFSQAENLIDNLSFIKGEIRNLFKRLTNQEFIVLLTIFEIKEKNLSCDYKILSEKLNLSESSIRDYVGKIIKKGIPIEKTKVNNKTILLSLSSSFQKLIPFSTLSLLKK